MIEDKGEFTVIGAGPVGLTMAMLLQKIGYQSSIFEKRADPRQFSSHGRSINLALSERGFKALGLLNLAEKIKSESGIAMKGRMIHTETGSTLLQPYSQGGQCIYSVSRKLLNTVLLNEAENWQIPLYFEQVCEQYEVENHTLTFSHQGSGTKRSAPGAILGCDGAFSALRKAMKSVPGFSSEEEQLSYGYKELTIPATPKGGWAMEKHALHIWPRKSFMLIALPNTDGSFTCTLFLPLRGPLSFESLGDDKQVRTFFETYFPDALALMPEALSEFFENPTSGLFMESCSPWNIEGQLLLLGDAAHAIVPFYGQGLNAGLEDCTLLFEALQQESDLEKCFSHYQASRKKDTDAIKALALQNFIEMRDLVTDEKFLMKRSLESQLKKLYPTEWSTQYELVTFSHVPYSVAQARGKENDRKLDLVLENSLLTDHLLNGQVTEQDMETLRQLLR